MQNSSKKLFFTLLFAALGLLALQVPVATIAGSKSSFTLFEFFAPIAGAFLGPIFGIVSVIAVRLANTGIHHQTLNLAAYVSLATTAAGTLYFALAYKKASRFNALIVLVPAIAMVAFIANPQARQAWYFSLYWLIPIFGYFRRDIVFIRALGATLTAHAVGGALYAWYFHLSPAVWTALVPVVARERFVFALGITVTYVVFDRVLNYLITKKHLEFLQILQPISA